MVPTGKMSIIKGMLIGFIIWASANPAFAEPVEIPRSVPGDKGRYYLLQRSVRGGLVETIHKRVGVDYVGYTKCEIDCAKKKMRVVGYGEGSQKAIKSDPTKWFDLVEGSSKSDLFHFICD